MTSTLFLVACTAVGTGAQAEPRRVPLEEVLRTLFAESPAFQAPQARTKQAEGARTAAAGPFDLTASTTVQAQRSLFAFGPLGGLVAQSHDNLDVLAGLGQRTRENVSVQLNGQVPLASSLPSATDPDQPQVTANLTVPILKLGRGSPLAADERAAVLRARAASALQSEDESQLAEQAAENYWLWVGSREQLAIARRVEELANQQLADVDQLVAQRARAAADRQPFAAAALSATASRMQSEEEMYAQEQEVWRALGLPPPRGQLVPADELPAAGARIEREAVARVAHDSARERPLLAYLNDSISAAREHELGARVGKRPDVAVVGQATVARVEDPHVPTQTELGYYGMVGLQFAMPLQNRAAIGVYEQASAARVEADLEASERRSAVDTQIDALSAALATFSASLQDRARAAEQYRLAFDDESTRFRLGSVTAMDVVLAEQQYVAASQVLIAERTRYAVALARLLHEMGALTSGVRQRDAAVVARRLESSIR